MKNKNITYLLLIFLLCLSPFIFAEDKNKDESVIVYFEPGKFKISEKDLDSLHNKLNKFKKYRILGYSCKEDKGSDDEKLAIASRRAEVIAKILVDQGFPGKNLTTVAYDESPECKAVVIDIEEQ